MEKISPGELKWRATAPWREVMTKDLRAMASASIPDVWKEAALYQINMATNKKVRNLQVVCWNPTNIQEDTRLVDEADLWCSATIGGEPYAVLAQLGKDSNIEFYPGNAKEMKAPWA